VASVQMKDRLADSGVIAVIVAERAGDTLIVEDLCVSCRALGRRLEDTFILVAIRGMPLFAGVREVAFRVRHGPRNQPALDWLTALLEGRSRPEAGLHAVPAERLRTFAPAEGVTLIME
jgi:predicted enzyme involved in methoxymalonyl-ACP biosynthesis